MKNDLFSGFRLPEPSEDLRRKTLAAARAVPPSSTLRPILGKTELAWLAAAVLLTVAHVLLPTPSALWQPAPTASERPTTATGDPALEDLLVAEAGRWMREQHRRLREELGLTPARWEGDSR